MSNKKKDLPYMPFYWGDWFKAIDVQTLPKDIRCTWFEMLGRMWESKRRGYLCINELPLEDIELAVLLGFGYDINECKRHLDYLKKKEIYSVTDDGIIYCRRMVEDCKLSKIRGKAGKKGMKIRYNKSLTNILTNTDIDNDIESDVDIKVINNKYIPITTRLQSAIKKNFPKSNGRDIEKDSDEIRKIIELDMREMADLEKIISKLESDPDWFWSKQIGSPGAMRGQTRNGGDKFSAILNQLDFNRAEVKQNSTSTLGMPKEDL